MKGSLASRLLHMYIEHWHFNELLIKVELHVQVVLRQIGVHVRLHVTNPAIECRVLGCEKEAWYPTKCRLFSVVFC